jgi:hypothetical protein
MAACSWNDERALDNAAETVQSAADGVEILDETAPFFSINTGCPMGAPRRIYLMFRYQLLCERGEPAT